METLVSEWGRKSPALRKAAPTRCSAHRFVDILPVRPLTERRNHPWKAFTSNSERVRQGILWFQSPSIF